jgi:hypothetical protein
MKNEPQTQHYMFALCSSIGPDVPGVRLPGSLSDEGTPVFWVRSNRMQQDDCGLSRLARPRCTICAVSGLYPATRPYAQGTLEVGDGNQVH